MKFLVDNALSPKFATGLSSKGFDAIHVRDIGLATASDIEIFSYAEKDDRIIISQDTDFGAILASRNASKPSFILFRMQDKRTTVILNVLIDNLSSLGKHLEIGSVIVFEDNRIRVRKLPFND